MKKRIVTVSLLALFLVSLLMPFFAVYAHQNVDRTVAAAFPNEVTGLALLLQGNRILPLSLMPSLAALDLREGLLRWAVALTALGALLSLRRRKGLSQLAALVGGAGALATILYCFYIQQLDSSVLWSVMITSKWYLWSCSVFAVAVFGYELWQIRGLEPLPVGDKAWRALSAALCAVTLLLLLLPFAQSTAQPGTFSTAAEDAAATRRLAGWQWIGAREPMLKEISTESGLFANPAGGGMQSLAVLGDSASNVKNLFQIPSYGGGVRTMALAGAALLGLGLLLQLLRKVDRWFGAVAIVTGSVLLAAEVLGAQTVDGTYQFQSAVYQMMFLGLGGYTIMPLLAAYAGAGAALCSVMAIRRADVPYFENPIPKGKQLLAVCLFLTAGSIALLLMPVVQVNLHTPGKIIESNPTVSQTLSGVQLMAFQTPDALLNPVNTRGKALYSEQAAKNGLTLTDLQAAVRAALNRMRLLVYIAMAVTLAGLYLLLFRRRDKRPVIAVLLAALLAQALVALLTAGALPKAVGFVAGQASIYCAMGFTAFAAFFAAFLERGELPKKYKLFLLALPFLVAVFLFCYLPLTGWRYAFYNYKLGIPMDQQEYVGFKWFTSLFANAAQRGETVRVLRNTFAMSGIGLAASWMPVAFAIFLTEIRTQWFKKFVQIFTTLPNFISWVLVFSFALAIFSLDTGVVNKLLMALGLIHEPIAYLNSSEYIWIKMWLWNTWKSLGWGAIMYLAAIAGIDQELYEAAKVDGAGRWRQILHITIPGLLPTFFVLLLLSISNVVNNGMEQYLVFQNAMNKSTIEVLDLYVFNISLGTRSTTTISMATAIGILKTLVSIVLLFLANRFSKAVRGESII